MVQNLQKWKRSAMINAKMNAQRSFSDTGSRTANVSDNAPAVGEKYSLTPALPGNFSDFRSPR